MGKIVAVLMTIVLVLGAIQEGKSHRDQPLSGIAIHKINIPSPTVLGSNGQDSEWVLVEYNSPHPSDDDWIGVFSPANFNASICPAEIKYFDPPLLCSAPIKFQYANYSNPRYISTGNASLKLQLINQRSDFSHFSSGLLNVMLMGRLLWPP